MRNSRPRFEVVVGVVISMVVGLTVKPVMANEMQKSNIVLMFIDDMGYGDIGPFGNKINQTPNLDRMAAEGIKFTDFYVSSTACTPSRSALMTGCYADRVGMGGNVVFPGDPRGLNPSEVTIADMLKEAGYATGCFGKWHLGDQPEFMPLAQGFDTYFGIPYSNDMWEGNKVGNPITKRGPYTPLAVMKQDRPIARVSDGESQALLCDAVTDAAIDFIRRHKDKPFFAYIPHSYVHLPRFVTPERAKKAGGDVTRAQVEEVDSSVGRIMTELEKLGIAENTLVFFTSDNGPASFLTAAPLRGSKGGGKYEGHMRVPTLAWWPGRIKAGSVCTKIGATTDMLPTLAALTGGKVPTDRIIDGKDISSLFLDAGAQSPHEALYYGFEGVRQGDWKLVTKSNKRNLELYNLKDDLGERNNLAKKHPGKVKSMLALLKAHEKSVLSAVRPAGKAENSVTIIALGDHSLPTLTELRGQTSFKAIVQPKPQFNKRAKRPVRKPAQKKK